MPWLEPTFERKLADIMPPQALEAWASLALRTGQADPLCCAPDWQLAFHEVFTPDRRVFYDIGPRAGMIFGEYIAGNGDIWLLPLDESWLFGQPLLGDEAPLMLADNVSLLKPDNGALGGLFISGIREPSTHASCLFQRFYPQYRFYRHGANSQARASLAGGMDGWLSRRSANHRAKLRKAEKKAAAAGIVFERARPDAAEMDAAYERILAVEARSWKGIEQCGMDQGESRLFYAALTRLYAKRKSCLVIFARRDGKDIGYVFGGIRGDYYRGQQFSYDNEYASFSLGNLLQAQKVAWLCELGILNYDMGPAAGDKMRYKTHWAERMQDIQTWVMRPALSARGGG